MQEVHLGDERPRRAPAIGPDGRLVIAGPGVTTYLPGGGLLWSALGSTPVTTDPVIGPQHDVWVGVAGDATLEVGLVRLTHSGAISWHSPVVPTAAPTRFGAGLLAVPIDEGVAIVSATGALVDKLAFDDPVRLIRGEDVAIAGSQLHMLDFPGWTPRFLANIRARGLALSWSDTVVAVHPEFGPTALDKKGRTTWSLFGPDDHWQAPSPQVAAPVVDAMDRVYVALGPATVAGIDPHGALLWEHSLGAHSLCAPPALGANGLWLLTTDALVRVGDAP